MARSVYYLKNVGVWTLTKYPMQLSRQRMVRLKCKHAKFNEYIYIYIYIYIYKETGIVKMYFVQQADETKIKTTVFLLKCPVDLI